MDIFYLIIIIIIVYAAISATINGRKLKVTLYLGIILFFSSILYVFYEGRSFYSIDKRDFTIWKTYDGCYIMPFRYWGLSKPNKNYLRLSNIGAIDIFVLNDSTLSIFADPHRDGYADIECHIENSKYYTYTASNGIEELEKSKQWLKLWNKHRSMYPYLSIDAREGNVKIWNYKDMNHIK